jgi:hypothetical protein
VLVQSPGDEGGNDNSSKGVKKAQLSFRDPAGLKTKTLGENYTVLFAQNFFKVRYLFFEMQTQFF